ncbi:MAG TPA: hypothetical protein PKL13_01200 [bacterium]|nr:hypothetical protein [bacterium]
MVEKYSATQTQVATKVSTKTKVLLGFLIVGCLGGMFAIASMGLKSLSREAVNQPNSKIVLESQGKTYEYINAESLGKTKNEQYTRIAEMAGVSKELIQRCVESEGQNCQEIRTIIQWGVTCYCTAQCTAVTHLGGCSGCGPNSNPTCEKNCGTTSFPNWKYGYCIETGYIIIGGILIKF